MQNSNPPTSRPPGMISAFAAGFNTVANHISLILFPVALDLFLLFGPRLSLKRLLSPFLNNLSQELLSGAQPDMKPMLQGSGELWANLLDHFNLSATLRSFPVGIPSLMAGQGPLANPLGKPSFFEIPNLGAAFSAWMLFGLLGLTLGSMYFNRLARVTAGKTGRANFSLVTWETMQSVSLFLLMALILLMVSMPVLLFLAVMTQFSSALTQFAMLIVSILMIWLLLPLVFSPHGIYAFQLDALRSTLVSYRLVRFFLPGTSLFLLLSLLISQGMDILWRVAPESSWLTLIGIAGHAFISTGLMAASFIYYYGGMKWMQDALQHAGVTAPRI